MAKREIYTDDEVELEVFPQENGTVTMSMKRVEMEASVVITLDKHDVNDLIKRLTDLSNDTPSIVSVR